MTVYKVFLRIGMRMSENGERRLELEKNMNLGIWG